VTLTLTSVACIDRVKITEHVVIRTGVTTVHVGVDGRERTVVMILMNVSNLRVKMVGRVKIQKGRMLVFALLGGVDTYVM
jgi:hypothetical protein